MNNINLDSHAIFDKLYDSISNTKSNKKQKSSDKYKQTHEISFLDDEYNTNNEYNISENKNKKRFNDINIDIPNQNKIPPFSLNKPFNICIFTIINEKTYPFLLYLLYNYENELQLIHNLNQNTSCKSNKNLLKDIIKNMNQIFTSGQLEYKGYCQTIDNNTIILKYIVEDPHKRISLVTNKKEYIWASPSEIINSKKVFNHNINRKTIRFFIDNNKMLFLTTNIGNIFEIPTITYYIRSKYHDNEFVDITRSNNNIIIGNCYYFMQENTINENCEKKEIVRVALFLPKLSLLLDETISCTSYLYQDREAKYFAVKKYDHQLLL